MSTGMSRWAPLTGAAFFVLAIASFAVTGETPDTDDPVREIVRFYVDNEDSVVVAAILATLAASFFVFFAGVVRRVLRDAEGPGGILSAVAFGGAIIFAGGIALDSTISFALADTANKLQPVGVQALSALYSSDFLVFILGLQIFLLATGISVVRHGAMPAWIGWIAIVLGVLAVTPIGFFAFLVAGILILIISVLLTVRAHRGPAAAT